MQPLQLIRAVFDELNIQKWNFLMQILSGLNVRKNIIAKSVYYVVENNGKVVGSAGVAPLENEAATICELQKMYFLPETEVWGWDK
jgi:putative acetyltransferase